MYVLTEGWFFLDIKQKKYLRKLKNILRIHGQSQFYVISKLGQVQKLCAYAQVIDHRIKNVYLFYYSLLFIELNTNLSYIKKLKKCFILSSFPGT